MQANKKSATAETLLEARSPTPALRCVTSASATNTSSPMAWEHVTNACFVSGASPQVGHWTALFPRRWPHPAPPRPTQTQQLLRGGILRGQSTAKAERRGSSQGHVGRPPGILASMAHFTRMRLYQLPGRLSPSAIMTRWPGKASGASVTPSAPPCTPPHCKPSTLHSRHRLSLESQKQPALMRACGAPSKMHLSPICRH